MRIFNSFYRFIVVSFVLGVSFSFLIKFWQYFSYRKEAIEVSQKLCRLIEPRVQVGANREVLEFLKASFVTFGDVLRPQIYMKVGSRRYTYVKEDRGGITYACSFRGRSDVDIKLIFRGFLLLDASFISYFLVSFFATFVLLKMIVFYLGKVRRVAVDIFVGRLAEGLGIEGEKVYTGVNPPNRYRLFSALVRPDDESLRKIRTYIEKLKKQIGLQSTKIVQFEKNQAMTELSRQVAHDIRSPLTALDMALHDLSQVSEEKRVLVRKASQRIHDIANNLLSQGSSLKSDDAETEDPTADISVQLISSIVEPLISEKRAQFRAQISVDIESVVQRESYGLFARVNATELSRVLSNLVNNSQEALSGEGRITVGVVRQGREELKIYVQDNGCGMTPEVLEKIGSKGFSFGKSNSHSGSGLGVHHARKRVESWAGRLEVRSQVGRGTTFDLILPLAEPPPWFVHRLEISPRSRLVILDDDVSVHQVWAERLKPYQQDQSLQIAHVSTLEALRQWVHENGSEDVLFLCDYEILGSDETGLDVVEELGLEENSVLVTSRFQEESLRSRCEDLGVKCLPKELARLVPIEVIDRGPQIDAVLIDDDELMHRTWQMAAKRARRRLEVFQHPEEFLKRTEDIAFRTPIYLDSDLGRGPKGEELAADIYARGYRRIYLCTGYAKEGFPDSPYICNVVDKTPVWELRK